jgi:4-amino-4-deoxy-L-arabinose transferase-like glycosyltransferase
LLADRIPHAELLGLIVLAGTLNLWALSRNGWANEYYAAAVRSMSTSWHDFLFASLDRSGVMTVDKPPLALWVQALSVRVFGYHSLSILVPQALMGVASVALVYDLVRRRFGRVGGFVAGLTLALTPITVAISRHNNPDSLLILCCVAALWCVVRAMESAPARPGTRWLVAAGVLVGLGFETKMLVALVVVPGIFAAWLFLAPAARGRWHALRQLLGGGAAMLVVGGAWPLLVELTPAADRPWISGTSNNTVLSLIFEYNGVGRVSGQSGGPGGLGGLGGLGGGNVFGGSPGPLRLLNSALGGQVGWLLGFAIVSGLGILVSSRLRRGDTRSGWLIAVGGAFATTAVLFSAASGIFHPYYVSLLAPFSAALVGAGAAQLIAGKVNVRIVGPLALAAGVATELAVLGDYPGQLRWLALVLIVACALAAFVLVAVGSRTARMAAVGAALAALLVAPSVWAVDTLGHATSGTFPAGGPTSAETVGFGGPGGGVGGFGGRSGFGGRGGFGGGRTGRPGAGGAGGVQLFGTGGGSSSSSSGATSEAQGGPPTGVGGIPGAGAAAGAGTAGGAGIPGAGGRSRAGGAPGGLPSVSRAGGFPGGAGFGVGGAGGAFGSSSLTSVLSYISKHGGGALAVSSQSTAAGAIIHGDSDVAGIGGFSGRESDPSISWLAEEVRDGKIRWVLDESSGGAAAGFGGPGGARETRVGSKPAMAAVAKACEKVTLPTGGSSATSTTAAVAGTLYDCAGRAAALASLSTQQSNS